MTKVLITEEMAQAVQVHLDYVSDLLDGQVDLGASYLKLVGDVLGGVEVYLDLSHVIPEGKGTADLAAYIVSRSEAHIVDFKGGAGHRVDPEWNKQLMIYGVGFLHLLRKRGHNPQWLVLHIVQPRAGEQQEPFWLSAEEADAWVETELKPAVAAVFSPDAPLVVDDDACRWCKGKPICPVHTQAMASTLTGNPVVFDDLDAADALPLRPAEALTPEQLGRALPHLAAIEAWVEAVRGHALHLLLTGHEVPAWKAVEGRRGARKWRDEDSLPATLLEQFGLGEEAVYQTTLASPAQIEKQIPKAQKKVLDALTIQAPGKPTLAPATDKREALTIQFDRIEEE